MRYAFGIMKTAGFSILVLLASATLVRGSVNQSCKAGADAASLVHVHGRLTVYNGGYPNLRLWQIGTHHLFGIYSDAADLQCSQSAACKGDGDIKLPSRLEKLDMLD